MERFTAKERDHSGARRTNGVERVAYGTARSSLCAAGSARATPDGARHLCRKAISITQSDVQKRQYIRHWHNNADWRNSKYYHLAIDTSRFSLETVAQIIVLAARDIDQTG